MNHNRSKFIAILTGLISILICVVYLLLITFFDSRGFINEYLSNHNENMGVIFYCMNSLYSV